MQQEKIRSWINLAKILWGLGFLGSIVPALCSFMIFDAPGSAQNPPTVFMFWVVLSFPAACLISFLGLLGLKDEEKNTSAFVISLLPLISVILFIVANLWLNISCGGTFNCR